MFSQSFPARFGLLKGAYNARGQELSLCPEIIGGAAAPTYRKHGKICPASAQIKTRKMWRYGG
jgi:hypothetical protein